MITCECGFEARAADEGGLVAAVRRHAAEAHRMPLSHDEALLLVFHAELAAQPTTPDKRTDPPKQRRSPTRKVYLTGATVVRITQFFLPLGRS